MPKIENQGVYELTNTEIFDPFRLVVEDRTAAFIDGPSVYAACKQLNFNINYLELDEHFHRNSRYVRGYFYTPMVPDSPEVHNPLRGIVDFLDYNRHTVVRKTIKEFSDEEGRRREKGNVAVEIAVDMFELAPRIDNMILFSGDGQYTNLVHAIKRRGVRVTVVSTLAGSSGGNSMIADDLRRAADVFVDLEDLRADFARK